MGWMLWAIDSHLDLMNTRGKHDAEGNLKFAFPELFKELPAYSDVDRKLRLKSKKPDDYWGYNNWRKKAKGRPELGHAKIESLEAKMLEITARPHMLQGQWATMKRACEQLATVLKNWAADRKQVSMANNNVHGRERDPSRVATEEDSSLIIEAQLGAVPQWLQPIRARLVECYKPILLSEYLESLTPQARGYRIRHIKLPYAVKLYTHCSAGNQNLYFLWRLPTKSNRSESENDQVIMAIKDQLPFYSSRATRKKFGALVMKLGLKGPLSGSATRKLLQDCFSDVSLDNMNTQNRRDRLERLATAIEGGDEDLILDLRELNFRVNDPKFDAFWDWCNEQFADSNNTAVDARRGDGDRLCPMAKFSSAPELLREARKELGDGAELPSVRWLYHQFHPGNPHSHASSKHTGRFQIKLKMQACILRAYHPDKAYCWHQWCLLRHFCVKWRTRSSLQSCDEKKSIPVGEPGNFVQAVEKTRKIITKIDSQWVALDHGWSRNNIVPSVALQIDIPDSIEGSWHSGQVSVCLKDKTFGNEEAAMRHTIENKKAREVCLPQQKPIMLTVHDGAADYNMLNGGALLAHVVEYLESGADMAVRMRFAPYHSYVDPVERIMPIFNMGLQGVSLARDLMRSEIERQCKSCNSMNDIRKKALEQPQIREAVTKAMQGPIQLVQSRFEKLEWTENAVTCIPPATEEELQEAWDLLLRVDNTIERGGTGRDLLLSKEGLQEFLETHTRQRTYMIQTMKTCKGRECKFGCKPLLLPEAEFDKLCFIPDPVMGTDEEYKPFEEVYGTQTSEADRPSLKTKGSPAKDAMHRKLLTATKARGIVQCSLCTRPRVIYTARKKAYSDTYRGDIEREKENRIYSCGDSFFPDGHELEHEVVVRLGVSCADHIEYNYYKAGFEKICCYCGSENVQPPSLALAAKYTFVFPTCSDCRKELPEPHWRKRAEGTFASRGVEQQRAEEARQRHGHRGARRNDDDEVDKSPSNSDASEGDEGDGHQCDDDLELNPEFKSTSDDDEKEWDWLRIEAVYFGICSECDGENRLHSSNTNVHHIRVLWAEGGSTTEVEGHTQTFPKLNHSEMELEDEVVGKVIRVYWKPEKEWYTGKIQSFNAETQEHLIEYDDNDREELNLLKLEGDRPAWELHPFTSEYFKDILE